MIDSRVFVKGKWAGEFAPILLSLALLHLSGSISAQTEMLTNGDFSAGDATGWTQFQINGTSTVDYGYSTNLPTAGVAPALRITSAADTSNIGLYQTLTLTGGREYTLSGASKDLGSSQAWTEVFLSTTVPQAGVDFLDGKLVEFSTWSCPGWDDTFAAACNLVSTTFTPTVTDTYYLVLKAGDLAGSCDVVIDEISLLEKDQVPLDDVESLLAAMTLAEKIGQMTQAERGSTTPSDVATYFLGSVLSGGGSAPADHSVAGWAAMHDAYQTAALSTRLGIPILYGIDAVHGHNNVVGATVFPHNFGLGATRDPDLVEEIGRITALEVSATGLEWTFSPCVAVARDERWGRAYESFGEDPELQTLLAARYVKGYQGDTMGGERVIACAKHYLGDGGTFGGVDQGNTIADEVTLRDLHLRGFTEAIAQGVGTVMPSYSSWNGEKMHGNDYLLTTVLKGELGFQGFVISDWNAIDQLPGTFYDRVVDSANAGVDMFMEPNDYVEFIDTLTSAVLAGDVPMARIDDATSRILHVKFSSGVMDHPFADQALVTGGHVGAAAHRAVAREAVRKSAVLLKNDNVLPLRKSADVFVAGWGADNIGSQCGGWTVSWQGSTNPHATSGTTILEGIQAAVASGGGTVTYDAAGLGAVGDVAVVVLAEAPYAEGAGDNLNGLEIDAGQLTVLNRVLDAGIPTVVVMTSGRPLFIENEIAKWDAFVAAWLPGTEADGLADVLFGDFDFTGKLPVSWPRNAAQLPINVGDAPYDPLFEYGFGLSALSTSGVSRWTLN